MCSVSASPRLSWGAICASPHPRCTPRSQRVKDAFTDGQLDELDGVTINYSDWWCSIRASNTEPLLRLNVEADNRALMERKRDAVLRAIRARV